jgi:integrase
MHTHCVQRGIVPAEAAPSASHRGGDFEAMAKRRYQHPKPKREGNFWYLRIWQDVFDRGIPIRKRKRVKLAPATVPEREVKKIADGILAPVNQGLITAGSAVNFAEYVNVQYKPNYLPVLAKPVQHCYASMIENHLAPAFGQLSLRDLTRGTLQGYFANSAGGVGYPTLLKIRDALSSILRSAIHGEFLIKNPMEGLQLPPDKRARRTKQTISPEQFAAMVELVPEPYATMFYTAMWTGLRISELIGLKWRCIHDNSIMIEERFCRGDWSVPKTEDSAAPIAVAPDVIARIHRLKTLTIEIRAGRATRRYPAVKAWGSDDLVFQSPKDGKPMRDGNVLRRFLKPAARKLGFSFVNWQCLRRSYATWMIQAGVDPKSAQRQMRHSRSSTTMDVYAQAVPAGQYRAVEQLSEFAKNSVPKSVPLLVQ